MTCKCTDQAPGPHLRVNAWELVAQRADVAEVAGFQRARTRILACKLVRGRRTGASQPSQWSACAMCCLDSYAACYQ